MARLLAGLVLVAGWAANGLVAAGPPVARAKPVEPVKSVAPVAPKPIAKAVEKPAPKPVTVPDADLERAIQARFARSKISVNGFTARVQNGVAVLEGKTGVIQHKGTATRLAKRAGARRVDNRIEISAEARARAAAKLATGRAARVHVTAKK